MMKQLLLPLALATACVDTPPLYEPVVEQNRVTILERSETSRAKTDLLIIVDDTVAMAPYQAQLAKLPERLASRIDWYTRRWIDLRVAVATNDGTLRRLPGMDTPWLEEAFDFDYTHRSNFDGALGDSLAKLMDVGVAHEGPSQPLEAARHALETGSELMRDDAGMMILTVSATDDASPWPVADYVSWLKAAVGEIGWASWRDSLISGIYLQPATRLDEYFKQTRAIITSLESNNPEAAIPWFPAGPLTDDIGCFQGVDLDPATPELDYDCAMLMSINGTWRTLPECAPSQLVERNERERRLAGPPEPCWWFKPNPNLCTWSGSAGVQVTLSGYTAFQHPALRFDCRSN